VIHKNSLLAFELAKPSITGNRKLVYDIIAESGGITAKEISRVLRWEINRITPRIYELREAGVVKESGSVKNDLGISVSLYSPTGTTSRIEQAFRNIETGGNKMVNADAYYGEYLKAEDVKQEISVTVKSVSLETIDGEQKLVVALDEVNKKLVLNKTNKDRLKEQFGTSETDEWKGKTFTLVTEKAQFRGEEVPALRVKKTDSQPTSKSQDIFDKLEEAV
jgi:hypothetical protein